MTPIDYIIAAIVIISMLFGAIRGFLRESIALLGWLTGLWLAWRYSPLLEPYLGGSLAGTELQIWVARIIVLLAVVIAAWLIGSLLGFLVQRSGLTLGIDRVLGALFGARARRRHCRLRRDAGPGGRHAQRTLVESVQGDASWRGDGLHSARLCRDRETAGRGHAPDGHLRAENVRNRRYRGLQRRSTSVSMTR